MRMPSFLKSTVFAVAATVLGSGAASAASIGLPGDGFYFDTTTSYESLVTKKGDELKGIFTVDSIKSSLTPAIHTYNYGDNGNFLTGQFDSFILDGISAPDASGNILLTFTGGSLRYYVDSANDFVTNSGNAATDFASATGPQLWLGATPQAIDASGHTLVITLHTATSASVFGDADTSNVLLDIVAGAGGGSAGPGFNTNTFFNSQTGLFADLLFKGHADFVANGSCGDFQVCGANTLKGILIPEPITLSLFGAGLAGAAALRRRKDKKA